MWVYTESLDVVLKDYHLFVILYNEQYNHINNIYKQLKAGGLA